MQWTEWASVMSKARLQVMQPGEIQRSLFLPSLVHNIDETFLYSDADWVDSLHCSLIMGHKDITSLLQGGFHLLAVLSRSGSPSCSDDARCFSTSVYRDMQTETQQSGITSNIQTTLVDMFSSINPSLLNVTTTQCRGRYHLLFISYHMGDCGDAFCC